MPTTSLLGAGQGQLEAHVSGKQLQSSGAQTGSSQKNRSQAQRYKVAHQGCQACMVAWVAIPGTGIRSLPFGHFTDPTFDPENFILEFADSGGKGGRPSIRSMGCLLPSCNVAAPGEPCNQHTSGPQGFLTNLIYATMIYQNGGGGEISPHQLDNCAGCAESPQTGSTLNPAYNGPPPPLADCAFIKKYLCEFHPSPPLDC